jgi:hypothetical protein
MGGDREMEEKELYSLYCTRCGEEIEVGEKIVISKTGNCYDSKKCLKQMEPEIEVEYLGTYNEKAVDYLNDHGKEESQIQK